MLESRPPNIEGQGEVRIRELVRNALRMRPDRIIVGEVRGAETLDMLQAMNTGHEGSLTTIHANSPRDALSRLETLVLTAGVDLPLRAIREQISSAFDLLVQISRLVDGIAPGHARDRGPAHGVRRRSRCRTSSSRARPTRSTAAPGGARALLGAARVHRPEAALPREAGGERRRPAAELLRGRRGRPGASARRLQRHELRRLRSEARAVRLVAVLAALVVARPRAAARQDRQVDTAGYPQLVVNVVTVERRAGAVAAEDGAPVAGLAPRNLGDAKDVVLAIDHSQSMKGQRASRTRPPGRARSSPRRRSATGSPSSRSGATRSQLPASRPRAAASNGLGGAPRRHDSRARRSTTRSSSPRERSAREQQLGRVIIVLTDGKDVSSTATLEDAVAAARQAGAFVYPIGIESRDFDPTPLRRRSPHETGGTLPRRAASSAELQPIYALDRSRARPHLAASSYDAARPADRRSSCARSVAGAGCRDARTVAGPRRRRRPSGGVSAASRASCTGRRRRCSSALILAALVALGLWSARAARAAGSAASRAARRGDDAARRGDARAARPLRRDLPRDRAGARRT